MNKHEGRGAIDLQNIKKRQAGFLYFDNFYSLILENNIVFYLSLFMAIF